MKNAIVTGANGFVGQYLVDELIKSGYYVYAVIRKGGKFSWYNNSWESRIQVIELNLDEISLLTNLITDKIDVFYHLAWQGSAGADRQNITLQLKNVEWTCNAIRVASQLGSSDFIGSGSIMELETNKAVYAQENRLGSAYIYGSAKQSSHSMGKALAASLGLNFKWAMITNAYGPLETSPRFINTTLRKMINFEPLLFTAGTQNYDFIYVSDVAKALVSIHSKGIAYKYYIIGSNHAQPLRNFVEEIGRVIDPTQSLQFGNVPFSGINLEKADFDTSELMKDTEFSCHVTFAEGIKLTYDWLKEKYGS